MTVSSETYKSGPYGGNGSATVFAYQFRILDETHLKVIRTDASGLETPLSLGAHYTVSGVGDAGGGNVVVVPAPVSGEKITILRNPPFTQETDLENQGAYLAQTVEDRFDLMTMQVQTVKERADRSVSLPASADTAGLDALIEDIVRLKHSVDEIDTVAAIAPAVSTTAASAATIGTVAANIGSVNTAAAHIGPIGTVSGSIASVNAAAANMAAIVAAPAQASNAAASATLAQRWANEAEDAQVSAGLYSAFHWAQKAMASVVGSIGGAIHGAVAKAVPVDADEFGIADSAGTWGLKRLTLGNLRSYLGNYFQSVLTWNSSVEMGANLTGDRPVYIDFHADDTNIDLSARIMRNGGVNGQFLFANNGTGGIGFTGSNAFTYNGSGILYESKSALLTGGYRVTAQADASVPGGTYAPDPTGRNLRQYSNNGAFTLSAAGVAGDYTAIVAVTNTATAGAVTIANATKVTGDPFTTTNGHVFLVFLTKLGTARHVHVVAMQ